MNLGKWRYIFSLAPLANVTFHPSLERHRLCSDPPMTAYIELIASTTNLFVCLSIYPSVYLFMGFNPRREKRLSPNKQYRGESRPM